MFRVGYLAFIISVISIHSAERIGRVVAVIGERAITDLDLASEETAFQKRKNVKRDKRNVQSQILDLLISRAIIDQAAEQESVKISEERIDDIINREMNNKGYATLADFKNKVNKELGMSWEEYREDMARQLKTQQVLQLKVSVPNPTTAQIEEWYKLNKARLGNKYLVRIISMRYKKGDTNDELRVSKAIKATAAAAEKDFVGTARKLSDHPSRVNGGLLGWQRLDELAQTDPYLAGAVNNTKPGKLSPVFISEFGYAIVKVEDVRPVSVDEVYSQIRGLLFAENEQIAFAKWIKDQRKYIALKVYLENYESP